MIDLSFLTEEEQEKIRDVLNRDAELKKCEERRVQNLQRTVSDSERLRFLTGEWFYETKQRRHQDRIHGSEIIRASMRHSHRPITILELSQILPEKPSFVDSENREVFVPPVLCGVLQEPRSLPGNSRCQQLDEPAEEDSPRPALTSPSKRRRNPFNVVETPCGDETDVELSAGRPEPSEGNDDFSSPVMSALKRLSSRSNNTSSKSLENLNSPSGGERSQNNSGSQGSLVKSKQTRSSTSVTLLQHDETDSDSLLESSLGYRRNTGSSVSNLSLSSGITSTSSVSSLQAGEVQGSVQLAVNFIQRLGEFHVFVVLCRDLAVADAKRNVSDPYVKCYLVPDKTKLGKRKTSVKKKTTNPTFNEILRFKVLMEVLKSQTLNVSVWHNNTFGRNSFLGDVDVDLSTWDFSNTHINEYVLKARSEPATPSCLTDSRGRMRVALRFLPQTSHSRRTSRTETGEVQIWVKDCKDLPPVRGVVIDPFVKCAVLPDTSQKSRQKTRVVKRTANPMFNHTMVYDGFRPEDLREACVEVTVWDHDRLNNHYIGGVRLGLGTGKSYGADVVWMDSTSDEASLWRRMLASDGDWVEDVLPLRMLLMAKSTSK